MRRVFIVRVKDDDPELRPHCNRLPQQKADRSGLADASRSQHGEVTPDQFADVDFRRDRLVLAQPADFDPLAPSKRGDGPKIVGADAVRSRAREGNELTPRWKYGAPDESSTLSPFNSTVTRAVLTSVADHRPA